MLQTDPFITTLWEWIEVFMRRSMSNFILFSKENGLSMSQIGALYQIRRGAGGVSDIGDDLGVTSAAASQLLERLVQQNLIIRSEDPHDRRVKQIVLTDKGRQILRDSVHARQSWLVDIAETLTSDEKELIMAALNIMINKAKLLEPRSELNH